MVGEPGRCTVPERITNGVLHGLMNHQGFHEWWFGVADRSVSPGLPEERRKYIEQSILTEVTNILVITPYRN